MRLFESIILLLLVVLVYQLVYSVKQEKRPDRLIFFSIIIIVIHIFTESYRWQMVPAYLSFGFIYLRLKIGELKFTQRINKFTWALWLILVIGLPFSVPVIELPRPTGPHPVGSNIYHWVDSSRTEWFTPEDPDDLRELVVQVWYPAKAVTHEPMPYIDHLKIRSAAIGVAGKFPGFIVGHINLVKTHSFLNAPPESGKYPLLILSHGVTGFRQVHTALIEELSSHGYIVVAPDHTYDCNLTVFPNGTIADYRSDITGLPDSVKIRRQQLNTRVADIKFILDQISITSELATQIDFNRIGVIGHSYGGATVIQSAYEDDRIKAVVSLDSWMNPLPDHVLNKGIIQPFLSLGRPYWGDSDYPTSPELLEKFMENLDSNSFHFILKDSRHLDFTDVPLFSPISSLLLETGSIPAKRAVMITNEVVLSFFDTFLKNKNNQFPRNLVEINKLEIE
ncbi:MAG: dienelactone hydrolase family protein [Candidatus Marinimicrobia bacterium]|nr:dienelactone hydrolase family protein [Candidatus Neomarinimicrobiota bacterium]